MLTVNPQIKILERLKVQLSRAQSIETSDSSQRDPKDKSSEPHEKTLAPVIAILLGQEEQLLAGSTAGLAESESSQSESQSSCAVGLALEVLNLTFRKLKAFRHQSDNCERQPGRTLSPQVLGDIAKAIWIRWNSPTPGLPYKLKTTLKNLLDYIVHSNIELFQCSSTQFFFEAIRRSILLEKRSLSILSHLVPLLPLDNAFAALKAYATHPAEFLKILLNAMADDKLASILGQLALHWTTKAEGWQYRASKPTDSPPSYPSNWILITISILFSSEERKRRHMCQYYLLPLFKTRPQCFVDMTEALPSIHRPHSINASTSSDKSIEYLSGLIALARLNPYQVCSQTQPSKNDLNLSEPWLPDEVLRMCLSHPAVLLRSSAFAIICQSTASTSHLPGSHLDLVMYFFTHNFGPVEPELKQNISSHLNVLFSRLRDSSNSSKKKLAELVIRKSRQTQQLKEAIHELDNLITQHGAYVESVKSFILKFLNLCRVNLTICSPYRCQLASLSYLLTLLNTGIDPLYPSLETTSSKQLQNQAWLAFGIKIIDQPFFNTLILALSSTYVNVREAAFTILNNCCTLDSQFGTNSKLKHQVLSYIIHCLNSKRESENCTASLLSRLIMAKDVMKHYQVSSPPSSAHDVDPSVIPTNPLAAFLCDRLDDLQTRILAAEKNLGKACEEQPIQGSIMVISQLFRSLSKHMISSLVASNDLMRILTYTRELILRVWELSAAVLCYASDQRSDAELEHEEARAYEFISAANEGGLQDHEEVFQHGSHSARTEHQIILSVCWRSMKEVSALSTQTVQLSLVAQELSGPGASSVTLLNYQDLVKVGKLFEQWLLEIRHRGAFSAIHYAYSSLCETLCALPQDSATSKLPVLWLQAHIFAITQRKISTTRRSAGLPYCILSVCQALSISNPNTLRESLNSIFKLAKGKEISSEAQVHILNTLKILLTDGQVSTQMTSSFMEMSYDLAITSFVSPDWKVRNGALILFSGLTNRVFGTRSLTLDRSHANLCKRETFSDFFRRLPMMSSILLNELRRSIEAGVNEPSNDGSQGPIFAILSLLALLQNPEGAPAANEFIKCTFVCLQSKVSKIRSIGADAMAGLIPCRDVPTWICDILMRTSSSNCYNQVVTFWFTLTDLSSIVQATLASLAHKFLDSTKAPLICQSSFLEILNGLDQRFGIRSDANFNLTSDSSVRKIQKLHGLRAPALNSYETRVTKYLLAQGKDQQKIVFQLLKEGYTATRLEVFKFLEKMEHRYLLNRPEISDLILSFASQPVHQVSIRQSALKLLGIESGSPNLNTNKWPLDELFKDYESCQVVPIRNALLALSAVILVNSVVSPSEGTSDQALLTDWTVRILDKTAEAAQEEQSAETRIFAVNGLKEFFKLYKMDSIIVPISNKIKLKVLELSINLIQDDDDEIRSNLIRSLHQTNFFLQTDDANTKSLEKADEDERLNKLLQIGKVQLELVPNVILEKLILTAVKLDPFFGFKKLLRYVDIESDLDQVMNLSSTDLFATERLNLYRDDTSEFNLIQQMTCNQLKNLEEGETTDRQGAVEKEGPENNKQSLNSFRDFSFVDLKEEIETLKRLMKIFIPESSSLDTGKTRVEEPEMGSLFKIVYINSDGDDDDGRKEARGVGLDITSYRSWFSLMTRLYHLLMIIKNFPPTIKSSFFLYLTTGNSTHQPKNDSYVNIPQLEKTFDLQFAFVQNIALDGYHQPPL